MIQFINIDIYMKNIHEKEKKLIDSLEKLRNLNIIDMDKIEETKNLYEQKNQLEIEKKEISQNLAELEKENIKLKDKFNELKRENEVTKKKEIGFNEKIDELNQETDSLLNELDKWET